MTDMNNIKITDEALENFSGGYVHADPETHCYEVIDDETGEVLDMGYRSIGKSRRKARKLGQSTYKISDVYLENLREDYLRSNNSRR